MLPKEHGAWNALLVSLFAGWIILGEWNIAALAASFFWISGFILRGPFSTYCQYKKADPLKSRLALGFAVFLVATLVLSGLVFYQTAPVADIRLVESLAIPLGAVIFVLTVFHRSLRFLAAEIFGFAGICLLVPTLFLTIPKADPTKALWLYAFFAGYFILSLFYVKTRQGWLAQSRKGVNLNWAQRLSKGWIMVLIHFLLVLIIVWLAPSRLWFLGPLYAGFRVLTGVLWGKMGLPIMKLGVREMIHSLVFTVIVLVTWKVF